MKKMTQFLSVAFLAFSLPVLAQENAGLKLPEGFKLVKGKIVEDKIMRHGGMLNTGDQADYGLVTTPQEYYSNTNFNNTDDKDYGSALYVIDMYRGIIQDQHFLTDELPLTITIGREPDTLGGA